MGRHCERELEGAFAIERGTWTASRTDQARESRFTGVGNIQEPTVAPVRLGHEGRRHAPEDLLKLKR
jgi:hypothetical protein